MRKINNIISQCLGVVYREKKDTSAFSKVMKIKKRLSQSFGKLSKFIQLPSLSDKRQPRYKLGQETCRSEIKNFLLKYPKCVDFKSDYNKTKRSKMDISNIYLKNESFEIFAQDGVKLVG